MDNRTKYARILKLAEMLNGQTLHLDKLKQWISMEVASSPKYIVETLHMMTDFGFIKEVEPFKYLVTKNPK